jgi:glycosyltransferase involved in cell wall biosynthesis
MNTNKKNILIVLPWLPYPFTNGGNQAMFNGIAAIKDKANVFVVYLEYNRDQHKTEREKMGRLLDDVKIVPFIINNRNSKLKFLCWLFDKLCFRFFSGDGDYLSQRMITAFRPLPQEFLEFTLDLIDQQHIEIVQMEMIPTLPLILSLPEKIKAVFVHHEIRYIFNDQFIRNIGQTMYRQSNLNVAKMIEIGMLKKCDAVITLSESDKDKLIGVGINEKKIYPSIAVVNSVSDGRIHIENCNILTFVGAEKHAPNRVGIRWFLNNCWIKLKKADSTYQLRIIGEWSDETKKKIKTQYEGVQFLGYVENLSDYLADTIMIVPLTIGSGIRMKILEATTIGIPFVSTKIGAEGLPFIDGSNCFLADEPELFIKDILKLKDIDLRRKFAESSMYIVNNKYSLDALSSNRLKIYNEI